MSKQHLFANRYRKLVPRKQGSTIKIRTPVKLNPYENTVTISPELPVCSAAHPGTKKLRIVCKTCNEGWMNIAEQDAFKYITSLIEQGSGAYDIQAQKVISLYLAIFFSIADREHLPTSGIGQPERAYIYRYKDIPRDWYFFLGRSENNDWQYRFRHHGGHIKMATEGLNFEFRNYQICTAGVGKLIMHSITSDGVTSLRDPIVYARAHGLALIHPYTNEVNMKFLPSLTSEQITLIADTVAHDLIRQIMPSR